MKKQLTKVDLNIPVAIIKDGKSYVAWTPALDLSTYGANETQARKCFEEMLQVFFDEFQDNPTGLEVVLESLGWSKDKKAWTPPEIKQTYQNVSVEMAV